MAEETTEARIARMEADDRLQSERLTNLATALTGQMAELRTAQSRTEGKVDRLVESANETRNASQAIERIFKHIADTEARAKEQRECDNREQELRWQRHEAETEKIAEQTLRDRMERVAAYDRRIDKLESVSGRTAGTVGKWNYALGIAGGFLAIIMTLAGMVYSRDVSNADAARVALATAQSSDNKARAKEIGDNAERLRVVELYLSKNPDFHAAGTAR